MKFLDFFRSSAGRSVEGLIRRGDYDKALLLLNEKVSEADESGDYNRVPKLMEKMAACYQAQGKPEAAAMALTNLGDFQVSRGQLSKALHSFERALLLKPGNPALMRRRGGFNTGVSRLYLLGS